MDKLGKLKEARAVLEALQQGEDQDIECWMMEELPNITYEHVHGLSTKQRLAKIEELTGELKNIWDTL